MEKAYDLKELGIKLKSKGLDLAEDGAVIAVESVFEWLAESAVVSATPFDDMAQLVMPELKKIIMAQVDKIDSKVG